ncbi:MAG: hypothetical protein ACQEP3_02850 [Patescibacteria group bacterium]
MIKAIKQNLLVKWFLWHFKNAPKGLLTAWGNFLRFTIDFFSIIPLFKTLMSPWKKLSESYRKGLANFNENLQILILNSFSRFLGFLVRIVVIFIGLIATLTVFVLGFIIFIAWFILPLLVLLGIIFSFAILI